MEQYYALIIGLLVSGALLGALTWTFFWFRTRQKIIKTLRKDRLGLSTLKVRLGQGGWFWFTTILLNFAVTGVLGYFLYRNLFNWFESPPIGGVLYEFIVAIKNGWLSKGYTMLSKETGEGVFHVIPYGFLGGVFLGTLLGGIVGRFLGRRRACRSFVLTSKLF